jgi:hypothetical protein
MLAFTLFMKLMEINYSLDKKQYSSKWFMFKEQKDVYKKKDDNMLKSNICLWFNFSNL